MPRPVTAGTAAAGGGTAAPGVRPTSGVAACMPFLAGSMKSSSETLPFSACM